MTYFHPKATVHISRSFVISLEYFIGCIKYTDVKMEYVIAWIPLHSYEVCLKQAFGKRWITC